ncbi:MAG: class I SAM-dependent methyltransferase, partial [Thaumarchaeota archaeon]|nr:class I SAM-dependent methyltransferase [Nitrososphaerota archaeon]
DQQLSDDKARLTSIDQQLSDDKARLTSIDQQLSDDKARLTDFKKEFVEAEIKHTYDHLLQREAKLEEVQLYANTIMATNLTIKSFYDDVKNSPEYLGLEYEKEIAIPVLIKKMNDTMRYSKEYENQIKRNPSYAICSIDPSKIAYYNHLPMSERFDEYFWVLKNLGINGKILDVGCSESIFAQELSKIKTLDVYGIDIRSPEFTPKFKFFIEDATATHFKDKFFDIITIISSIEHFGLDFYGNKKIDENADLKTMKELKRILKDNGIIFLTIPYGREWKSWYRRYDDIRLKILMKDFEILELKYLKQTHIGWEETDSEESFKSDDSIYYKKLGNPGAVAFIKAKKIKHA